MIKKLVLHFWSMRGQFARYFITGLSAVFLDLGSLYLLEEYLHFRPVWAVVVNQIFLLNYVFFINKHWSFKSHGITHKQLVRFLCLCGVNYVFSIAWMWFFNEKMGIYSLTARLMNVVLAVAWNFLIYRYWVYKTDPAPAVAEVPVYNSSLKT
jgi:putative flippase GtrA